MPRLVRANKHFLTHYAVHRYHPQSPIKSTPTSTSCWSRPRELAYRTSTRTTASTSTGLICLVCKGSARPSTRTNTIQSRRYKRWQPVRRWGSSKEFPHSRAFYLWDDSAMVVLPYPSSSSDRESFFFTRREV